MSRYIGPDSASNFLFISTTWRPIATLQSRAVRSSPGRFMVRNAFQLFCMTSTCDEGVPKPLGLLSTFPRELLLRMSSLALGLSWIDAWSAWVPVAPFRHSGASKYSHGSSCPVFLMGRCCDRVVNKNCFMMVQTTACSMHIARIRSSTSIECQGLD